MFETKLILLYVVLVLGIAFVSVKLYFNSKFKRDTQLSEFYKSLWNFKFVSIYCVVMICVGWLFFPTAGYYSKINTENSTQEEVLQQIVENQQEMVEDIALFRQIGLLGIFVTTVYFASLINFLRQLQIERQRNAPQFKKPLGLESS